MKSTVIRLGLCASLLSLSLFAQERGSKLLLKAGTFDPLVASVQIPDALKASDTNQLWIVQFAAAPTNAQRNAIREAGGEVHSYLPDHAHVVRMPSSLLAEVRGMSAVRWVGAYEPVFRLEAALVEEIKSGRAMPVRKYNIVVVDKHSDKPGLVTAVQALGGVVTHEQAGSILLEVQLTGAQLGQVVKLDSVLWIDRWTPIEYDMDNARIQGGGNYVETLGGYTGKGVNGHVYEGVDAGHVDFNSRPINVLSGGGADSHGHCTAGIVFGNGTSHVKSRGMAPDAQAYYTQSGSVTSGYSRWQVVQELVTNRDVMFTTASWGNARTRSYTSISADADDIIFDHGIAWTQSQSNAGNQDSRPQAWAKNIFSIGGVRHYDNSNPADDSWAAGGGSTGPAADGRIKPDLSAYYDNILTSDRTGSAGYTSGDYTTSFGGTSGATPIVAGHNALALQMFTDGLFGNVLRKPGGTRFENRPHFSTLKALQIANAQQYSFSSGSADNRREHVGWGFPGLKTMYDNRNVHFIVDEEEVLTQGQGISYQVNVAPGQGELKISMCFADPAGNPAASITRINDLTLRVTSPSGVKYWGNAGLKSGNYSASGGAADDRDTVENVFVKTPAAGAWTVDVIAFIVAQASHVETPATDADFGLVVNGAVFVSKKSIGAQAGSVTPYGQGCLGTGSISTCLSLNGNGGSLTRSTASWEYAYEVNAGAAISVTGFRIWTSSKTGGNVTVPTAIYASSGNGPGAQLGTGSMVVGTTEGFYTTTLAQPINIAAGATFYISGDTSNSYVSTLTSGTAGVGYYGSPGSFSKSGVVKMPSYTITCVGGGQQSVPVFTVAGKPEIGQKVDLALGQAALSAPAVLFTGAWNKIWLGGNLPFDLGVYGAPGCTLLTSTEAPTPMNTDQNGSISKQVTVPNNSVLVGVKAYQQFMILDPGANTLGVSMSNAVEIKIGG